MRWIAGSLLAAATAMLAWSASAPQAQTSRLSLTVTVSPTADESRGGERFAPPPAAAASAQGGGACCTIDDCLPAADETECSALGGVFLPGEDCANDACGPGACCSDIACVEAGAYSCITAGRDFIGAGTSCADDPCQIGTGACCLGGGMCEQISSDDCAAAGGTFLGPGVICDAGGCDLGACCVPDECLEIAQFECDDLGGEFFTGVPCADNPCNLPVSCPEGTLFGQQHDDPDDFVAGTSELSAGFQRFEDFSGAAGTIESVVWWGLDLDEIGGNFVECVENDNTFNISFHEDAAGQPGAEVCSYTLTATREPTGIFYLGAEMNKYTVDLPEPCVLVNGWISIVGLGDPECWFLWMSAGTVNAFSWCQGCTPQEQGLDFALCLVGTEGGVTGACCDDATGECADGVDITACAATELRFAPGQGCGELDPPCGTTVGACCVTGAECSIETESACGAIGGDWLGPDTICAACPCEAPCPPDGIDEGEPTCSDGYIDEFNGGCDGPVPVFSSIAPGQTVCGESGVFNDGDAGDFDWYEIVLNDPAELTWSATAEFPAGLWIADGTDGCAGGFIIAATSGLECDPLSLTVDAQPGTYWLIVGPIAFADTAACGAVYTATLSTGCPWDLDGDGTVGTPDFLELLAQWGTNPGGPPDFDGDGTVGTPDFLELLANWGGCPKT